jgi:cytochrome c oxidase subunit 4
MNQDESSVHTVGYGIYILVWIGLVVFTGLTVVVSAVDFKALAVAAALGIAATKSILVLFYFMHLKYEPQLFRILVFVVVLTLVTFIILTFLDVLLR